MKSSQRSRYAGQFRGIREGVRGTAFRGEPAECTIPVCRHTKTPNNAAKFFRQEFIVRVTSKYRNDTRIKKCCTNRAIIDADPYGCLFNATLMLSIAFQNKVWADQRDRTHDRHIILELLRPLCPCYCFE